MVTEYQDLFIFHQTNSKPNLNYQIKTIPNGFINLKYREHCIRIQSKTVTRINTYAYIRVLIPLCSKSKYAQTCATCMYIPDTSNYRIKSRLKVVIFKTLKNARID